jgi:hypothetical protein
MVSSSCSNLSNEVEINCVLGWAYLIISANYLDPDCFEALFYSKNEMGLRMAYWFGFAAVAGAFGGLVGALYRRLKLL